jgi:tetratricopeptide (TPR) repeat protein
MRVLVALGSAGGKVLSRDDLIELCWDGTIVGDNAINRVIFRLRHALDDLSDGAVRLETIPRVGFRLVYAPQKAEAASTPAPEPVADASVNADAPFWTRKMTRRAAAGGITLLGGGALAYATLGSPVRHVRDPRALDLYRRGQILLKSWELGSIRQAIAFNKQAVAIDPDYADAWGALAIAYIHGLDGLTAEAKAAYPGLVRSAAERALALDPDQAEAHFALAIPYPHFRRWYDHEQRLRPLVRRFPDYWYGHAQLGILLTDVGRYEEAIVSYRRAREIDPMAPISSGRLAHALQQAGHDQEADLVLDEALARWPEHVFLWVTRSSNYIEGGRYDEAIAFGRDPARRPIKLAEALRQNNEEVARALATGEGAARLIALYRDDVFPKIGPNTGALGWLAALGAVDLAFEVLEAYYLGGNLAGQRYPPPGPLDKRPTGFGLLNTSILEQRNHPRFKALLERTGLEGYWRKSRTQPDFRKG